VLSVADISEPVVVASASIKTANPLAPDSFLDSGQVQKNTFNTLARQTGRYVTCDK